MGWTLTVLGVALVIVVVAGAALALCRRYCIGWQWGTRNVWNVCEEWRQRLSWLWAPREEKVGLVKAQHPTAQSIPGLYRQPGNMSQHLLHSDSDIRLNEQGAFTRFESVDRDLHPPLGSTASTIPPQPLRPAPQPRPIARPRPSPLQPPSSVEYLRMQEADPGPLTPPPSLQRVPRVSGPPNGHGPFRFDEEATKSVTESIQMTPYITQNHVDSRLRYELEEERRKESRGNPYRQFEAESTRIRYGVHGAPIATLDDKEDKEGNSSYGSYDIVQRNRMIWQHVRNDSRGSPSSFGMTNSSDADEQNVMGSIYGPEALSNMPQSLGDDLDRKSNVAQSIEMTRGPEDDIGSSYLFWESSGLQMVSQYIQSLPDLPIYDSMNELPPPPAPPDPPKDVPKKSEPTTGERIFNALRLVTSQSYIDASEFYSSVLSSAQQVPHFPFSPRSPTLVEESTNHLQKNDPDVIGRDDSRCSSDLYSPVLNLKAHRTAQEVYNSLRVPPPSPLKDHNQVIYMTDPSFRRTSEDILNSMEGLNGIHELNELDDADSLRKRNNQECYAALDEVQLKQTLSEILEDTFLTSYTEDYYNDFGSGCRRVSQGPEPKPPLDDSNLQRAMSCESMFSNTSLVSNDLKEEAPVVGQLCVGVEYDRSAGRGTDIEIVLVVNVLEARDLVAPNGQPAQDTFVRVCVLPDRQMPLETRLYKGSPSPSYQEKFLFPCDSGPTGRTLLVEVFCTKPSLCGDAYLLGEASLRLGPPSRTPRTTWLPIIESTLPTLRLGELMFSLSYWPTAAKLKLVVVKANNLRGAGPEPGGFFVKVCMLQQGQYVQQKKTSTKRGETSPIFNEAMSFDVPITMLEHTQLRLVVREVTGEQGSNSKQHTVGHVIVGPTATERALAHWWQMLYDRRHPVAMWHPLRM